MRNTGIIGNGHMTLRRVTSRRVLAIACCLGNVFFITAAGNAEPQATPANKFVSLSEAQELLTNGDYDAAIVAFQNLAGKTETKFDAQLGLAKSYFRTGQYTEAAKTLLDKPAKESEKWHYLVAKVKHVLGDYAGTIDHLQKAIKRKKSHAAARLLYAQTLEMLGQRDDAIEAYRWFDQQLVGREDLPRDAAWITDTAQGFLRYSVLTQTNVASRTQYVVNDMLQPAYTRLDRSYWPARIVAANLLREKYNNDVESGCISDYEGALRINSQLPEAYVGLGEVALGNWDFDEVEVQADKALKINPNFAPALHLLAKNQIQERRYADAIVTARRSLDINGNDLNALSLIAAASACLYDTSTFEGTRSKVRAINERSALFHGTVANALAGIRQYADSEREFLLAIELDPTNANAHTELGMMYMQWGLEGKARDVLETAWTLDPFNQRTKFTLELLETIEKLDRLETEHFIIRSDAKRDPALAEAFATYLERIHDAVEEDYGVKLRQKTTIQIYPTQREFAVRITGQPWIHTVGACTGSVIAMASPRKSHELMGPYHFARVLKHEYTHTITLAATKNRIPHWFTEGLAVAQEDSPRSFDLYELLARAARRDELFTLAEIDWAFMRPRRPTDRTMAYAQSEWMCEYLTERFGYSLINEMLTLYKTGQTQRAVFKQLLKISLEEFDKGFEQWARKQVKEWGYNLTPPEDIETLHQQVQANQNDAILLGRFAKALFDDGEYGRSLEVAKKTLAIEEGNLNAVEVFVTVLAVAIDQEKKRNEQKELELQVQPVLDRLLASNADSWIGLQLQGEIALRREDWPLAKKSLKRLQRLCPMNPASWAGLAGIYLHQGQDDLALPQLLELTRTKDQDADIPAEIGRIYRRKGRLRDALYWFQEALYISHFDTDIREELARTAMQAGDTASALREHLTLTAIQPENAKFFELAAFSANKLGDTEKARELALSAVKLNPTSDAASLIR